MRSADERANRHILRLQYFGTNTNFAQSVKFTTRLLSLHGDELTGLSATPGKRPGLRPRTRRARSESAPRRAASRGCRCACRARCAPRCAAPGCGTRRSCAAAPRCGACRVVVIAAEQVVRARLQPLDAAVAPGIDAPRRGEERRAGVGELAVGELRTGMARAAVALADEDPQAALRRERIARGRGIVAALQRIAEVVERRAARDEGLLEGGEGFADTDKDFFIRGRRWAEDRPIFV